MALNYGFQYLNNPIFRAGKYGQIVVTMKNECILGISWESQKEVLSSGS
tara:strand:+ start:1074 stop:1220 length:147 start_codon:yes stop_codon:yes gene_type:complete